MVSQFNRPVAPRAGERGFTLIELSIVLIIIGLIIGGILQGQEMIRNTRLKTQVSQFDAIQAAINTFEDKFDDLPGDFANGVAILGATAGTNGDGDGVIDVGGGGAGALSVAVGGEMNPAMEHLRLARLIDGVNTANNTLDGRLDQSLIDIATYTFANLGDQPGIRVRGSGAVTGSVLRPSDAFSIDTKYDDGIPGTGRYQAGEATAGTCFAAAAYVSSDTNQCYMVFSMR